MLYNFVTFQGRWGVEGTAATPDLVTITGVEGGVTPFEGVKMLKMLRMTGSSAAIQAFQVTNVTSYAPLIDTGGATINLSAFLNVDSEPTTARANVSVEFFSGPNWPADTLGYIRHSITLDNDRDTWQPALASGAIPVDTRWVLSQVGYNNDLLGNDSGYVDATELTIVPEPATLGLLVMALLSLALFGWRRRTCS